MPRLRMLSMLMFLAICPVAEEAWAQRAWVSGTVLDSLQAPLPYANVVISGSVFGAMTDSSGAYRIELVPGRHTLRALMMGFKAEQRPLSVGLGEHATVDFVLVRDQKYVRGAPAEIREHPPKASPVNADQLQSIPIGVYPAASEPVRCGPLDLILSYTQSLSGDSVRTQVVARGTNVTKDPVSVCGCFSFWKVEYGFGPEVFDTIPLGGTWQYRGPTLDVNASECDGSTLGCTPVDLKPGGSISREMHFSFRPADFADWPGQVSVTCIFFQGKKGATWADTDHVVLTAMPFAVPVRPLDKPYKSN